MPSNPLLALLCSSFLLSGIGGAQTIFPFKLNPPLVEGGDVWLGFQVTADGTRVVYQADQETVDADEIYSVPLEGGGSIKHSGNLVTGGSVSSFLLSTGSPQRLVYTADQDVDEVVELFSVPLSGGPVTQLNPPLISGGNVFPNLQQSVDGSRVVYMADQDQDDVVELYSVPIEGGPPTKLNDELVAGGDVLAFVVSPYNDWVIYAADQDANDHLELYSVQVTGGTVKKLNGNLTGIGLLFPTFGGLAFSPDGIRAVYQAEQDGSGVVEVFSATLGGRLGPAKLNGTLPPGVNVGDFQITPDGQSVVYRAEDLFYVSMGGGFSTRVNDPLLPGGRVISFRVSPDGNRVVYSADHGTLNDFELYSIPLIGIGQAVKLNGPVVQFADVTSFRITPDSSRVVYYADASVLDQSDIFSVPIDGGTHTRLNGPLAAGGTVEFGIKFSPDGSRVVYRADQDVDEVTELYSVPVTGGTAVKLNGPMVAGGNVLTSFEFGPEGRRVIYHADEETNATLELFIGRAQAYWETSGGNWFTSTNWEDGVRPDQTVEAVVAVPAVVELSSTSSPAMAESLVLGGAAGSSVLRLSDDAVASFPVGMEILPGGVLQGDGVVSVGTMPLALPAGAEVRVGEGEQFTLQSGPLSNEGRLEALGTTFRPAELTLEGAVTNQTSTGALVGHHSIMRMPQGVVNRGSMSFGAGLNDVFADLSNESGGIVTVSGGAIALFHEDVTNSGTINVSALGGLSSAAVFFGSLSGNGVAGSGQVFVEGDTRPGFSPGAMAFGGDLAFGPLAALQIELSGPTPGSEHDRLEVNGNLVLGGSLEVTLLGGFTLEPGMVFDLWNAASVSGAFTTVQLPELPEGLFWQTESLSSSGELRVGLVPGSYAEFAAYYGLLSGPLGDEEGDGRLNLFEYLSGGDPLVFDAERPLPMVVSLGTSDEVSFALGSPGGADLTLEIETSTTLREEGEGGWEVIAIRVGDGPWDGPAPVTLRSEGAGLQRVTVAHVTGNDPRRFYRLKATLMP